MIIETSRFGRLEVDEQRLITFPEGILGFPSNPVYALVQTGDNPLQLRILSLWETERTAGKSQFRSGGRTKPSEFSLIVASPPLISTVHLDHVPFV